MPVKMRNWTVVGDRRNATIEFRDYMEVHPQTKQECCDKPDKAKEWFARIGHFYLPDVELEDQPPKPPNVEEIQIPRTVQFKVYDAKDEKRNDLALLVLPSSKGEMSPEASDVWIAAWPQWDSVDMIAQLEARLALLRLQLQWERGDK